METPWGQEKMKTRELDEREKEETRTEREKRTVEFLWKRQSYWH